MVTQTIGFKDGRNEVQVSDLKPLPVTDAGAEPTDAEARELSLERDAGKQILVELRVISRLLAEGFNVSHELGAIRDDESASVGA